MSAKEFKLQLNKEILDTDEKINIALQKIGVDALKNVVKKSPVDTGRFRGNWQTTISSTTSNTLKRTDRVGNATINAGTTKIVRFDYKKNKRIFIQNNLPYANRLENGWSKQAPKGMVSQTIQLLNARYREILI